MPQTTPETEPARLRLVVLASGAGSLLQALLAAAGGDFPARVVAVGLDRDCPVAAIAEAAGVPVFTVALGDHPDRAAWDAALTAATAAHAPDLVVSAGFMKILGPVFLAAFGGRAINTHPALLPAFPGAHAVADALAYGVKLTGATVHLVDGGVDTGPILAQRSVEVLDDDDTSSLHERIKTVERRLLVDVIAAIGAGGLSCNGRHARIGTPQGTPDGVGRENR